MDEQQKKEKGESSAGASSKLINLEEDRDRDRARENDTTTTVTPSAANPIYLDHEFTREIRSCLKIGDKIGCSSDGRIPVHSAEKFWSLSEDPKVYRGQYFSVKLVPLSSERLYRNLQHQVLESRSIPTGNTNNILEVEHAVDYQEHCFVIFPSMNRGSLRSLSTRKFPQGFPEDGVIVILHRTLKALSLIHSMGKDHREISAGHIYVNHAGVLKLGYSATIFEVLEEYNPEDDPLGDWVSVPRADEDTQKADIWLLGVTALELAYGTAVFKGRDRRSVIESMVQNINKTKKLPNKLEIYNHDDEASTSTAAAATTTQGQKKKNPLLKLLSFNSMKSRFTKRGESREFSKEFEKLVVKCLAQKPAKRPTADELLQKEIFTNRKGVLYFYNLIRENPEEI